MKQIVCFVLMLGVANANDRFEYVCELNPIELGMMEHTAKIQHRKRRAVLIFVTPLSLIFL